MPTALDTLREELNKLNAAISATRRQTADLAKQLLRDCTAIGERVRSAPESIEALLSNGVEAMVLINRLGYWMYYGHDVLETYRTVQADLSGSREALETLAGLIKEAEAFVTWVSREFIRCHQAIKPRPPIDEEMLRERARQADEANSWIDIKDARAELERSDS